MAVGLIGWVVASLGSMSAAVVPRSKCGAACLACRRSAGRHARHNMTNDVIARALRSIDVPVELEPAGVLRANGRPDGATLVLFSHGKCIVWDFTCSDSLTPLNLSQTSLEAGQRQLLRRIIRGQSIGARDL